MTAEQYAAERQDLGNNWNLANDQQWVNANPDARDTVDYILSFRTFLDYLRGSYVSEYSKDFDAPGSGSNAATNTGGGGGNLSAGQTAEQFAAANPDLELNWNRAHSAQWISENPGSGGIVAAIQSYPTFLAYLRDAYGQNFAAGGGNVIPPGSPISLAKPTMQVGTTAQGLAVMQLVDSGGTVKQWIVNGAAILDLVNAPTYGTLFHTTATDAPRQTPPGSVIVTGGGGGGGGGGSGNTNTTRILHPVTGWPIDVLPTWTRVGTDGRGNPIFKVPDAAIPGNFKQFTIDGRGMLANLVDADAGNITPTVPPPDAPPVSPPPHDAPPGSLVPGQGRTGGSKDGTSPLLWAALAALAYFATR